MITSKLMSKVLGKEVVYTPDTTSLNPDGNQIVYFNKPKGFKFGDTVKTISINKYEFMHLCEEYISSSFYMSIEKTDSSTSICIYEYRGRVYRKDINSGTKFEAVIKATQWVIDNKDEG